MRYYAIHAFCLVRFESRHNCASFSIKHYASSFISYDQLMWLVPNKINRSWYAVYKRKNKKKLLRHNHLKMYDTERKLTFDQYLLDKSFCSIPCSETYVLRRGCGACGAHNFTVPSALNDSMVRTFMLKPQTAFVCPVNV
ncbi:hypothetical protein PUN28_017393 [Cardiocondyla obscurior]|uniref:Uncharacterized protein n=1 Tax=Cardiocondyla obscurior TaxID=286306 RepID=A0AAW2ENQ3_9HYME